MINATKGLVLNRESLKKQLKIISTIKDIETQFGVRLHDNYTIQKFCECIRLVTYLKNDTNKLVNVTEEQIIMYLINQIGLSRAKSLELISLCTHEHLKWNFSYHIQHTIELTKSAQKLYDILYKAYPHKKHKEFNLYFFNIFQKLITDVTFSKSLNFSNWNQHLIDNAYETLHGHKQSLFQLDTVPENFFKYIEQNIMNLPQDKKSEIYHFLETINVTDNDGSPVYLLTLPIMKYMFIAPDNDISVTSSDYNNTPVSRFDKIIFSKLNSEIILLDTDIIIGQGQYGIVRMAYQVSLIKGALLNNSQPFLKLDKCLAIKDKVLNYQPDTKIKKCNTSRSSLLKNKFEIVSYTTTFKSNVYAMNETCNFLYIMPYAYGVSLKKF